MKSRKKIIKRILWTITIIFVLMNVVAIFHSYKFTHFVDSKTAKTKEPKKLTTGQKITTLIFGVSNPRPTNEITPSTEFETISLNSNKKIECWNFKVTNPKGTVILFHGFSGKKSSMLDQFRMFEDKEEDKDLRTEYLEWLRKYKEQNEEHFNAIRKMPLKVRCIRKATEKEISIAFVKNGDYKNIYLHSEGKSFALPFEKAVKIFEAPKSEEGVLPMPDVHYKHINHILEQFERDISTPEMIGGNEDKLDIRSNKALNDLNNWLANQILSSAEAIEAGTNLLPLLKHGTYTNLTNEVYKLRNETNPMKLEMELIKLSRKYTSKIKREVKKDLEPLQPKIIISETFL